MKLVIFSLLTLIALRANSGPQIIGGEEVSGLQDPIAKSTVRIHGQIARASFTCSGVLIAQNVVLTAGHCLGPGWAVIEIYFSDGRGPITLHDQVRPDNYTPGAAQGTTWNDLAILTLKAPAPSEFVPVPLADASDLLTTGEYLTLAGYGQTNSSPDSKDGLGTLRKISQNILNPHLNDSELTVNLRGGGPCFGDSGGPAYLQTPTGLKLVGITSRLTANDIDPADPKSYQCTNDMIYSNVVAQSSWIKKQMSSFKFQE